MKRFLSMMTCSSLVVALSLTFQSCNKKNEKPEVDPLQLNYKVKTTWPHDTEAFTQGLVIHNGLLYESTGQNGQSWIGVIDINTGKPDKKVQLDQQYFGEGITILNNKLYHITWKSRTGFVYNLPDFSTAKTFSYETEGWGLTHDGKQLIMSDGSDKLFFRDSVTLEVVRTLKVTYKGEPLRELNELEYIDGHVFANIWQTNRIARIDPATGIVTSFLDLSQLATQARVINNQVDVLNGIAWHKKSRLLLVTGKYWPLIYILKLGDISAVHP
jgi:glutamine cyclotransferase